MSAKCNRRARPSLAPDLSAKLERLKRGLKTDTISMSRKEPKLFNRFGVYDPLRRRSKEFRKAITTYAPPYYFWHRQYIRSFKHRPTIKTEVDSEMMDTDDDHISCEWCQQSVLCDDYDAHRLKKCRNRHEFSGNGYFQCAACKESFLNISKARQHVSKHFPNKEFVDNGVVIQSQNTEPKSFDIICRDQAKRKKWL